MSEPGALIEAAPAKKPKASYVRFAAEQPNETWQADVTHHRLAHGADAEILTWLDDHSRYALSVTAHQPVTGVIVDQIGWTPFFLMCAVAAVPGMLLLFWVAPWNEDDQ